MSPARVRLFLAGLVIAVAAGLLGASPALDGMRGLSLDILTALRWQMFGVMHDPANSPTVVIAIDEESYRTPPFDGTPSVTWTREIGRVLTATIEGGAKVVGFDIIFPTSIEQSGVSFGTETLGEKVRGFDRDFLRALALGARAGKVVLGQIQHSETPLAPAPGQRLAVGRNNIRFLNAYNDPDDIIRRLPLTFTVDGERQPSMALELAARGLGTPPEIGPGGITIGGYRVPSSPSDTVTMNFDGGADDIPTYSLADLRACLEKGDTDFFQRNFSGKIVLIGTLLDVEDRRVTSKRFATAPERANGPRCALPPGRAAPFARDSISGVYMHATAINNMIHHDAVREPGRMLAGVIDGIFAGVAVAAALALTPVAAAVGYVVLAVLWIASATAILRAAFALPLADPLLLGAVSLAIAVAYRFVVSDKDKRLLRKSFALYLAPSVIDQMLSSSQPPKLGGEVRTITVLFSDVAGFSSISEGLSPADLVTLMNEYLSAMSDIVEDHGGFVDKYVGDAIVAVFGAPVHDEAHAANAVRAALACQVRLKEMNESSPAFHGHKLGQRIGLNTGDALIGNIGSKRRFNYTVMGDMVNLASRLEGANKYFGTAVMASEATVAQAGTAFRWRELDAIRVKGRDQPVKIFEPLALESDVTAEQIQTAETYAEALACWRARDFAGAAASLAGAADDPPAAALLKRAQAYAANPPPPDWEAVNTLEGK